MLGYRSNIAHRWETGQCYPNASVFLRACARIRPANKQLFVRFFKRSPSWLDATDPFSPSQLAAFLQDLRGKTPLQTLAERSGYSRFQLMRWLQQKTQPKLPEFLGVVEAASRRVLDFVAELCDPALLPASAELWQQLTRARELAYTSPWSHAVLRALELDDHRALTGKAAVRFLAKTLGVHPELVEDGLQRLCAVGQVRERRGRYEPNRVMSIDTSHDAARARGLKIAWAEVAVQRMREGAAGNFGYSVFAVSREDLGRVRDLHLEYVRAMQALVAASKPNECVALYCSQLLDLSGAV
jgi:hypothetical protein